MKISSLYKDRDCLCDMVRLDFGNAEAEDHPDVPNIRKRISDWQSSEGILDNDVYMVILFGTYRCFWHGVELEKQVSRMR